MAKLTILGDALQIKSDLTKKEIERVKKFAPTALKLYDEDENEIFAIDLGDASLSKYGICFCSEDAEGKVFMTTNNPIVEHFDPEAERARLVEEFATVLHNLELVEGSIKNAKGTLEQIEASVDSSVTFAQ